MAKRRSQSGPDLFDEVPDLDDLEDESSTADVQTSKRGDKDWAQLQCEVCGRKYDQRYLRSKGLPEHRCCGSLFCDAMQTWSPFQWRMRARSIRRRPPPPRPYTVLRVDIQSECDRWRPELGRWCGGRWATYVLPPGAATGSWRAPDGHDRLVACTGCGYLVRTFVAEATASDRLDAEALRRFPGPEPADSLAFGAGLPPVLSQWLTGLRPGTPAMTLAQPVPVAATPIVAPVVAMPVEPPPAPVPPPPLPMPPIEPLRPPGPPLPGPSDRPARVVAQPASRPARGNVGLVCLLVDRQGSKVRAKCGREATIPRGGALPDVLMVAASSQVTCTVCDPSKV